MKYDGALLVTFSGWIKLLVYGLVWKNIFFNKYQCLKFWFHCVWECIWRPCCKQTITLFRVSGRGTKGEWRWELMSAWLKVSLHHVATWSHRTIHHSCCCLRPVALGPVEPAARWPNHSFHCRHRCCRRCRSEGQGSVFKCWFNALRYNTRRINPVMVRSLRAPFDLAAVFTQPFWKGGTYEIIHSAKAGQSYPTHNPST